MFIFILLLLILSWLALYLILSSKWKKILVTDFPLFLLCGLLLGTDVNVYATFGENRQIGISVAWLPILYWLYLRRLETAYLFKMKPANLILGSLLGILYGIGVAVFITNSPRSSETFLWSFGFIFNTIQKSIAEEIVFRCLLIIFLQKDIANDILVNVAQGLIFGLFHIGGYWQSPVLLLIPISFGLLAGFMVTKQKSIYVSVLAHVLNNTILTITILA